MKIRHVTTLSDDLVHRHVTSSNGLMTISCDLAIDDGDLFFVDGILTCVFCIAADWRAVHYKLMTTRSGRMSSERSNL